MKTWYSFNYPNDTSIEYTDEGNRTQIECTYRDEDPNNLLQIVVMGGEPGETQEELADDLLTEIIEYLDATADGIRRTDDAPNADVYDDYNNSALYAWENMLRTMLGKEIE